MKARFPSASCSRPAPARGGGGGGPKLLAAAPVRGRRGRLLVLLLAARLEALREASSRENALFCLREILHQAPKQIPKPKFKITCTSFFARAWRAFQLVPR